MASKIGLTALESGQPILILNGLFVRTLALTFL